MPAELRVGIDHGWAMVALDDTMRGRHVRRVVLGDMARQRCPPRAPFRGVRRSTGREAHRLFLSAGDRLGDLFRLSAACFGAGARSDRIRCLMLVQ
jgi:hypothetical protein